MASSAFWLLICCASVLAVVLTFLKRWIKKIEDNAMVEKRKKLKSEQEGDGSLTNVTTTPKELQNLNGPKAYPLIGSLHLLGSAGGPFEAFTNLARVYGDIYEIQLGVSKCVIVSSYPLVKEVLITKGAHFGGRPDFMRFHSLFGGDRNNSLALCDWSEIQRKRRSIARSFCSPRGGSCQQEELSRVATEETTLFLELLNQPANASVLRGESAVKPLILRAIGNMFTRYMCSTRFGYHDETFNRVVRIFDEIFWDINQGYAVDFLPWLKIFYTRHLNRLSNWATHIRSFILTEIIEPRRSSLDLESGIPRDFTDALLLHLESPESELSWQHIIFELEDFLGGHSAIGNLVMMVLANAITHPDVQSKIQAECDSILKQKGADELKQISLEDRKIMPYTESVIWETLRVSSSPIVPHVATCDTNIGDYRISKDSVIFLNNYELNLGEKYWGPDSKEFRPERFIKFQDDKGKIKQTVSKPDHFLPFSTGKRTCIGQRLVQGFAFIIITGLLTHFDVSAPQKVDVRSKIQPSCVALAPDCFNIVLTPRSSSSSEDDEL